MAIRISAQDVYAMNLCGTRMGVAVYHPILFRERTGRVGDVGFFNKYGQYQVLCNAFHLEELSHWHLRPHVVSETIAVIEEEPDHFRIAFGGNAQARRLRNELGRSTNGSPPGVQNHIKFSASISMSVVVPGENALLHRACIGAQMLKIIDWFGALEMKVWEGVNTYFSNDRPDTIFLITGQTLTDQYAITYQEQGSAGCEVTVEICGDIPPVLNSSGILGHGAGKVCPLSGFEIRGNRSSILHSIFIEVHESKPIQRFRNAKRVPSLIKQFRALLSEAPSTRVPASRIPTYIRSGSSGSALNQDQIPERVQMQKGTFCSWYLLRSNNVFAVQYTGSDPRIEFPPGLDDDDLYKIVDTLHKVLLEYTPSNHIPTFDGVSTGLGSSSKGVSLDPVKENANVPLPSDLETQIQNAIKTLHETRSIPFHEDQGQILDTRLDAALRILDNVRKFALTRIQKIMIISLFDVYSEKIHARKGIPREIIKERFQF